LIDAGPKTKEAQEALREGFLRAGVRFGDLRRLVLTHTHEDHYGLARTLRDHVPGLEIYVHPWETGHTFAPAAIPRVLEAQRALLARSGVPENMIVEFGSRLAESAQRYGDTLSQNECLPLIDDAELVFASGALRVVHTPGHTPGSCSLLRERDRTIFAGDTILKRITPNPVLYPDPINSTRRFQSLAEYLVSLARIRSFAPTLIHGAHGEPVSDYEELFNRYVRRIQERQGEVLAALSAAGATAWETSRMIFPDTHGVHSFLALSEVSAHLDLALAEGKLATEMRGDEEVFRKSGIEDRLCNS
jgi:glyoxylase-like metal-dependent hydrolase (beta-lactamase superfamily II)